MLFLSVHSLVAVHLRGTVPLRAVLPALPAIHLAAPICNPVIPAASRVPQAAVRGAHRMRHRLHRQNPLRRGAFPVLPRAANMAAPLHHHRGSVLQLPGLRSPGRPPVPPTAPVLNLLHIRHRAPRRALLPEATLPAPRWALLPEAMLPVLRRVLLPEATLRALRRVPLPEATPPVLRLDPLPEAMLPVLRLAVRLIAGPLRCMSPGTYIHRPDHRPAPALMRTEAINAPSLRECT